MKIWKDTNVTKLDSLIQSDEEINDVDISLEGGDDSDDFFEYDPSFQKRFISSTSNDESQNKSLLFDYINISEEVYDIVISVVGETKFTKDKSKNNSLLYEQVNKNFSNIIREIRKDERKKKFPGIIGIAFIQFSEYIELEYYDVFHVMNVKFQEFIKKELINSIGIDSYRRAERRSQENSKPSINNHFDALIKKIEL